MSETDNIQIRDEVILVDERDRETGVMEKMEAHRKGLLHRAISVFLINDRHEVLIQQRAHSKYHSPGLWSNTCCSHPRPGEATDAAAVRRLQEEMGITCRLREAYNFVYQAELEDGLSEHEFDHVFVGRFNDKPQINRDEVADWKYIHINKLLNDIQINPDKYTYWFKLVMREPAILALFQTA